MKTILISGASIAGPTLAYWLAHHGFKPTLVERASSPRPGGQAIDIRGAALSVVDGMGILGAVQDQRTRMKGVSQVDDAGSEMWRSEEKTLSGGRFDAGDVEILRDDLAALLLSRAAPEAEMIYGDSIASLEDDGAGVLVHFDRGLPRRFDLVVGADGVHSRVRELTFGDESQYLFALGIALAVYSAPNMLDLSDWQIANRGKSSGYLVYTARGNTQLRIAFGFEAKLSDEHRDDQNAQKQLVADRCGHFGWNVSQLLDAMWEADDFYFGVMTQVRMESWTQGRVALVGDAGYCPSPLSGQGTSLALVGAYVLAHELAQSPSDFSGALARYENKMRPYVLKNQLLATRERNDDDGNDNALDEAKNAIFLDGLPVPSL